MSPNNPAPPAPRHSLVRFHAGVLDGGSAFEVLLESQLKGLTNGGDDVLSQAATTLQDKASTAVPTVLGNVGYEVQCVLWKGRRVRKWDKREYSCAV